MNQLTVNEIKPIPWPPVSEKAANELKELYLSRNWSFNCPAEKTFTENYTAFHSAKHGIFMANGTVTLEAALAACGVGKGDEVIVPALTWMATAMAVHYVGAKVVFVDVEASTLCLDPALVEKALNNKTKAIIGVHLYGSMADIGALAAIAKRHNLAFIEDCAHMQGGMWDDRGVGSWGDVGSFSFQQSKAVSSGEGGICLTNDSQLADLIYRYKHIGYGCDMVQGEAGSGPDEGFACHNYRATGFQAVILNDQLGNLENQLACYNKSASIIAEILAEVPGLRIQSKGRKATVQGYYGMVFIFDGETLRDVPLDEIIAACREQGLKLVKTYGPVYEHILFNLAQNDYCIPLCCPVAEYAGYERAAVLTHHYLGCDETTIRRIADIIKRVVLSFQKT